MSYFSVSRLETLYTHDNSGHLLRKPFKYCEKLKRDKTYQDRCQNLTLNDKLHCIISMVKEEIQRFEMSDRLLLRSSNLQYQMEQVRRKALKQKFKVYCICPKCVEHYQYYFQIITPSRILKRL
jgi:hypothetical protein